VCQHRLSCSIALVFCMSLLLFLSIMSQALQYGFRFQYQEQAVGFIVQHILVSSVNRALHCVVRFYEFPISYQHMTDGELYFLIFILFVAFILILFELCYLYSVRYFFLLITEYYVSQMTTDMFRLPWSVFSY
jgi:hypothetical protein